MQVHIFFNVVDFEIAGAPFDGAFDEDADKFDDFGEVVGTFGAGVTPEAEEGFYGCGVDAQPLKIERLKDFVRVEDSFVVG